MSSYKKGYRREKEVRRHYEKLDYSVIESRGSHGIADLICGNGKEVHVIQVKSWSDRKSVDMNQLARYARRFKGKGILAYKKDYGEWVFEEV